MCCVRIVRRIRSGSGGGSEDDLHPIHKRPGPPQQQQQQLHYAPQQQQHNTSSTSGDDNLGGGDPLGASTASGVGEVQPAALAARRVRFEQQQHPHEGGSSGSEEVAMVNGVPVGAPSPPVRRPSSEGASSSSSSSQPDEQAEQPSQQADPLHTPIGVAADAFEEGLGHNSGGGGLGSGGPSSPAIVSTSSDRREQQQQVEGLLRSGKPALSVSESKRVADFLARHKDLLILCADSRDQAGKP